MNEEEILAIICEKLNVSTDEAHNEIKKIMEEHNVSEKDSTAALFEMALTRRTIQQIIAARKADAAKQKILVDLQKKKLEVKTPQELGLDIPPNFVVFFNGRPYVTQAGLLYKLHKLYPGQCEILTEVVQLANKDNAWTAVFKATVRIHTILESRDFVDHGIADPESIKMESLKPHLNHLASTRAVCRALRLATAHGFASAEEQLEGAELEKEAITAVT